MRDYIEIGSSPVEEPCVQVNKEGNYHKAMREECLRFIELLRRTFGPEPEGARLSVKSNPHDFGTYYEVVCYFEDNDEEARKYAFRCEAETPARWDQPAAAAPAPVPGTVGDLLARRGPHKVCDSCLSAAEEMGVEDRETAGVLMREMGADVDDHLCDVIEAPDVVRTCACACGRTPLNRI